MSQGTFRVAATVHPALRSAILRVFRPQFGRVCCDTISYAFRVAADFPLPFFKREVQAEVYGHYVGDGFDALAVSIEGQRLRPDGRRLSLTLSLANGVERAAALLTEDTPYDLAEDSEFSFPVQFQMMRLTNLSALPRRAAA